VRAIEHISPQEIRLAILHVVEAQFGLDRKILIAETAYELGYGRTGTDISEWIGGVADGLVESGQLRISGFQVTFA